MKERKVQATGDGGVSRRMRTAVDLGASEGGRDGWQWWVGCRVGFGGKRGDVEDE